MVYIIFEVKNEDAGKINKLTADDLVSRQSILTRDAGSLELEGDVLYVKVEGSDDGLKRAQEIAKEEGFKKLDESEASKVNEKIEEQEDDAASGMGMIFE